jgi:hypothetical protein
VDFRCPTVRLCKCADFSLTRHTRCSFYLFGRPTSFKLALENHAVFPLLDALSNEFGKPVLRTKRVGSFLMHVRGGRRSKITLFTRAYGDKQRKFRNNAEMAMTETRLIPTKQLPFWEPGRQPPSSLHHIQHHKYRFRFEFCSTRE